jgi:Flp pilus assembly pilin Flp
MTVARRPPSLRRPWPSFRFRARDEHGAALVEFALVAPILFLVLMAILDFGRALNYWIDATHLASEGSRFAVVNRCPSGTPGGTCLQTYIRNQADTNELKNGSGNPSFGVSSPLQVCITFPNGTSGVGDPVRVATSFSFHWIPLLNLGTSTIGTSSTMRLEAVPTNYAAGCA